MKGNPKFLVDIPRVLSYVKRNLEKYPELHTLHSAPDPLCAGTAVMDDVEANEPAAVSNMMRMAFDGSPSHERFLPL